MEKCPENPYWLAKVCCESQDGTWFWYQQHQLCPKYRHKKSIFDELYAIPLTIMFLTNRLVYNHTVILTFKPFLIVHKSWQKTLSTKWGDNPQLPIPSNSWLSLACDVAVKAASRLVDFMSDANQINPEVKVCILNKSRHLELSWFS